MEKIEEGLKWIDKHLTTAKIFITLARQMIRKISDEVAIIESYVDDLFTICKESKKEVEKRGEK